MTTSARPPLGDDALRLLPAGGTAPRCASHAREIAVDPGGTALAVAVVVAVSVPKPWPKPVFAHPRLDGITGTVATADGPARILARVPDGPDDHSVHLWRRSIDGTDHLVLDGPRSDETVADVILELIDHGLDGLAARRDGHVRPAGPALLVCTQGSHDVCCGSDGERLAVAADAAYPAGAVHRVSHTGGHRFAPTALTFPDGRMWAFLAADDLPALRDGTVDPAVLGPACRGWWGAAGGAAQVAERAVWMATGRHDDRRRVEVSDDRGPHTVLVDDPDAGWDVVVTEAREIPVIACRADGGLPAKPGREWSVSELRAR